jgi:hypothetical protein
MRFVSDKFSIILVSRMKVALRDHKIKKMDRMKITKPNNEVVSAILMFSCNAKRPLLVRDCVAVGENGEQLEHHIQLCDQTQNHNGRKKGFFQPEQ